MLLLVPVTITVPGCINLVQNDYYNSKRGHNIKLIAYSTVSYINTDKWATVSSLFFMASSHCLSDTCCAYTGSNHFAAALEAVSAGNVNA